MRLFSRVVEAGSFTRAARTLGMPKQTLSRRIAELEQELGVQLLHRTTRSLKATEVGAAYALRCADVVRLAEEADRAVTDARAEPSGVLRVTADPVFGEAFLPSLVVEVARAWPSLQLEVVLTRRKVDLVEEGFDVAFRIGRTEHKGLTATLLGPAQVRYCCSRAYLKRRGAPKTPFELDRHDCILVLHEGEPVRWPFSGARGLELVPVDGRLRFNSFALARAAALGGLGIAIFPDFACAADVRARRLVTVLDDFAPEVGGVTLVHPAARYLSARVRAFVELAQRRLAGRPWVAATSATAHRRS
jgi:DNA-binding transcriptional LysR family regulator